MKDALNNKQTANLDAIWAVYNHMPNGQVVVTRFIEETRQKKVGGEGATQKVVITAEQQFIAFILSDFVALYQNGKLEKKKALIYTGNARLKGDPRAHAVVHKWAEEQGVKEYLVSRPKTVIPTAPDVENRLAGLESGQKELAGALNNLAQAISNMGNNSSRVDSTKKGE